MEYKRILRFALSLLALAAVSFYFMRELQKNWTSIQAFTLNINLFYIVLSVSALILTYLLVTYGWFLTLNALSDHKLSYTESIAVVNASNLTKYIPGKVWSYAFQMYWLADAGFSKSLILYVNLVNLCVALLMTTILGLCFLVFSPGGFPGRLTLSLLVALFLLDLWFIKFHSTTLKRFISALNRILKREIGYYEMPTAVLLQLHLVTIASAFFFGLGAFVLCIGIGFDIERGTLLLVMSSMMIADVIGFVAFIVPGGLGVRESVMYLLLSGGSSSSLALILPIASRIVNMFVDVVLGAAGIILLKRFATEKR